MSNYKELTIDYLEGRFPLAEYEDMMDSDDGLHRWFQSMVPEGKECYSFEPGRIEPVCHPYDIRIVMKTHERLDHGGPRGTIAYHYYIRKEIADIVSAAFPDERIELDARLEMIYKIELKVCPSYIDGVEVAKNNIIGQILFDLPMDLPKSKLIKIAKERIKKAFHIEGNKWPHWIQSPEWPVFKGKPMKYDETVRLNREFVQHYFYDLDTGYVRVVDDFF